jgi:transposase
MLHSIVTAADIQDRDSGASLLGTLFGVYPFLLKLYADGGYQGPEFRSSVKTVLSKVNVETVKRADHVKGFVVPHERWVVEKTLAWLNHCRRLAKDWGKPQSQGAGFSADGLHPPHGQKVMPRLGMFPDRL